MKLIRLLLLLIPFSIQIPTAYAQKDTLVNREIREAEADLERIRQKEQEIRRKIEMLKFDMCQTTINTIGTPKGMEAELTPFKHAVFSGAYHEKYEQSAWIMHLILPEIMEGNFGRTNDFRIDTLIKTGTAEKDDYWNSGYDRGHLAPSADFRWSAQALSESYLYSNMSPQKPELNRERWAEMEDLLRAYVINYQHKLIVVSGPVFSDSMKLLGKNEVAIPYYFYKVAIDPSSKTGIGFMMPNGHCSKQVLQYAVPIDSIEKITGLNFFPQLNLNEEANMEKRFDASLWRIAKEEGNVDPISPESLPKGKFNTSQAKYHVGEKITVCGTVVSTKYAEKSGATFINLDRKFPDQIFTIQIWKDARMNFSYEPETELKGKTICVTGKITENQGIATMTIANENAIEIQDE